jgi:hypothetical protein
MMGWNGGGKNWGTCERGMGVLLEGVTGCLFPSMAGFDTQLLRTVRRERVFHLAVFSKLSLPYGHCICSSPAHKLSFYLFIAVGCKPPNKRRCLVAYHVGITLSPPRWPYLASGGD